MDIIKIKIKNDKNIMSYIKLIREFDKTVSGNYLSFSEIKKRIEDNQFVYSFDLDSREWMNIEKMTKDKWQSKLLEFLKDLIKNEAKLTIYHNNEETSLGWLENWIHSKKDTSEVVSAEINLEELDDLNVLEPYNYLWTSQKDDWGVVVEEYNYSIINLKTHEILSIENEELKNAVASMMIMMGNKRFDSIEKAFKN